LKRYVVERGRWCAYAEARCYHTHKPNEEDEDEARDE
jgi:hypothetical protein